MDDWASLADIPALLKGLSLEQKVGQMFMVAFDGPTATGAATLIREHHVGACYLSNDNLREPGQAALLSADLQTLAGESSGIPLLLAADQEGAWAVLTSHSCPGPGNMALGATYSESHTRAMYTVFGRELRAVGLNVDLAPVADANTNPQNPIIGMRSFGEEPGLVARHVTAAVAGLHDAGVAATSKHFPGHGDTTLDSHRGLAAVDRPRALLEQREFVPFRAAVASGVDIVMTAHVIFTALDPSDPATLSPAILRGLLREEMKFAGVILTDSFNMGAMRRAYQPLDALIRSINAGADIILLAEERYGDEEGDYLARQVGLIEGLVAALRRGRVSISRMDEAVTRIVRLKARCDLTARPLPDPEKARRVVGTAEHRSVESRAAEAAIIVLRNRDGLVPLRMRPADRLLVLSATSPEGYRLMTGGRGIGPNVVEQPVEVAFAEIKRRHANTEMIILGDGEQDRLPDAALLVVVTEKLPLAGFDFPDESQHRFIQRLMQGRFKGDRHGAPVIVLGCRDPYELAAFPEVDVYVSAMGYRPVNVRAAVRVLFGEIPAQGSLPVSIPGLYRAGWSGSLHTSPQT